MIAKMIENAVIKGFFECKRLLIKNFTNSIDSLY